MDEAVMDLESKCSCLIPVLRLHGGQICLEVMGTMMQQPLVPSCRHLLREG